MQYLFVFPLFKPFYSVVSIYYCCYDFWLVMKRLLMGDETTLFGYKLVAATERLATFRSLDTLNTSTIGNWDHNGINCFHLCYPGILTLSYEFTLMYKINI